jgi:hypothetical protein
MTRELTHVAWQAPPNGFYKANWDAAIDTKNGRMGFGVVIRDHRRQVVAACSRTQESLTDVIIAQSWAGMIAATLCKDMGIFYVILGDSKQIVKEINECSPNSSR